MKKKVCNALLFGLVSLAMPSLLFAQKTKQSFEIGLMGGSCTSIMFYNEPKIFSNDNITTGDKQVSGLAIGVPIQWQCAPHFSLRSGINYLQIGTQTTFSQGGKSVIGNSYSNQFIQIPLIGQLTFGEKIQGRIGVGVAYNKLFVESSSGAPVTSQALGAIKRGQMGGLVNFGMGIKAGPGRITLDVTAQAFIGNSLKSPLEGQSYQTVAATGQIGYMIPLGMK